jgi:hypothetical protein
MGGTGRKNIRAGAIREEESEPEQPSSGRAVAGVLAAQRRGVGLRQAQAAWARIAGEEELGPHGSGASASGDVTNSGQAEPGGGKWPHQHPSRCLEAALLVENKEPYFWVAGYREWE